MNERLYEELENIALKTKDSNTKLQLFCLLIEDTSEKIKVGMDKLNETLKRMCN